MFGKKKNPKLLMVEDTLPNHDLFRKEFGDAGFEVTISQNAEGDIVTDVANIAPDIISMDLMLGSPHIELERDGFATIELLKNDERTKDIPIFVLTNFFEDSKVRKARNLGVVDFISLQGQSLKEIAAKFTEYLSSPRKYKTCNPIFREPKR
jgi:CheY-like chemotaxis protein